MRRGDAGHDRPRLGRGSWGGFALVFARQQLLARSQVLSYSNSTVSAVLAATESNMASITYTFPADFHAPQMRGVTCTGGQFQRRKVGGSVVDVCAFETRINGQQIIATVAGKPELEAAMAAEAAAKDRAAANRAARLAAAVPGLDEYERAASALLDARTAYERASDRGYPAKEAAALKDAESALGDVVAAHPVTAIWAQIQGFIDSANAEKSALGQQAIAAILAGESAVVAAASMRDQWSAIVAKVD